MGPVSSEVATSDECAIYLILHGHPKVHEGPVRIVFIGIRRRK
jgi:hypothetical protein